MCLQMMLTGTFFVFSLSAKNVRKPKALPLSEASRAVANAARVQKEQTKSERGSRYNEIPWDEMYNRLVLFKEKYGVSSEGVCLVCRLMSSSFGLVLTTILLAALPCSSKV